MKQLIIASSVSFVSGIFLTLLIIFLAAPGIMMMEDKSNYDFQTTMRLLEESVEKHNWKIVTKHDLQGTLKKFGKNVRPVTVFELCHPDHAGKILEGSDERIVSSLMPCRVSVYEKNDGTVYISRMNSGLMAGMFGGIIAKVMKTAAHENELILAPLFN